MDSIKSIFREDPWATPLLALSVIALCALLLYAVVGLCSRIKPNGRTLTFLPWLQMPLLLGLMTLASTSIVAAVPLNEASCRILFLGPGIGYVLLAAGLLSRIVQHTIRPHIVVHWLLLFFVVLNQVVISGAYLHRSWSSKACVVTVHDQLLVMLYPGLLVAVVLLLVYRTARRTRSEWKSREAIHTGLAATFSGAFAGCWLGAASVLGDVLLPSSLGYGCLATVIVVSLISLLPRQDMPIKRTGSLETVSYSTDTVVTSKPPPGPDHHLLPEKVVVSHKQPVGHHQQHQHVPGPGRGTEKPLPSEPEIVIVPVTGNGRHHQGPDMKALHHHHHHHQHRRSHQRSPSDHHHHLRESGRHHHRHHRESSHRPHRWNNKLLSRYDLTSSRRRSKSVRLSTRPPGILSGGKGLVRNVSDVSSNKGCRTPYNHRGWLY